MQRSTTSTTTTTPTPTTPRRQFQTPVRTTSTTTTTPAPTTTTEAEYLTEQIPYDTDLVPEDLKSPPPGQTAQPQEGSGQRVRLRNGPEPWEGLVQVYLGDNLGWGFLCDVSNNWTLNEANVVCNQLGYERLGWKMCYFLATK